MKSKILLALITLSTVALNSAHAASSCELLQQAKFQQQSCADNLGRLRNDLSAAKDQEARLIAALSEDHTTALARCEQDSAVKERDSYALGDQLRGFEALRYELSAELARIDQTTRNRLFWECTIIDLKTGFATMGSGRSQEEARRDAWNRGDFSGHGDHTACFQVLRNT